MLIKTVSNQHQQGIEFWRNCKAMTLDDIRGLIGSANWFTAIGTYVAEPGRVALPDLHDWDDALFNEIFPDAQGKAISDIARQMDWLPSTIGQEDPIHGRELVDGLKQAGIEYQPFTLELHKATLVSLRGLDRPKLKSGPNDSTKSAIGAATFCVRMAALESLSDKAGFWCALLPLYARGYWPCGLMPDGRVVVY